MSKIDDDIMIIDKVICRHINSQKFLTRGEISQDILAQLRNFVEAIMLKIKEESIFEDDEKNKYDMICDAINYVKTIGRLGFINKFHDLLQITSSHYTLDEEKSERVLLKYFKYILKLKDFVYQELKLSILHNLDEFPFYTDKTLKEYYEIIADKIDNYEVGNLTRDDNNKFYIKKIKPFYVKHKVYYEITFIPAKDHESKHNRIIAFTKLDMIDNYASRFHLVKENIEILGKSMPITIITGWKVAIRNCEFNNFVYLVTGKRVDVFPDEQIAINKYITLSKNNLCDLMDFSDNYFYNLVQEWKSKLKSSIFVQALENCRKIIKNKGKGQNILRYLLNCLNNSIIKKQTNKYPNEKLSNLYLSNGCIPFDEMPYINSLKGHNPQNWLLFDCISMKNREHEFFANFIKNNTEIKCELFTRVKDINNFKNIEELVREYNSLLWSGHQENSKLVIENGQVFLNGYKNDTCLILNILKEISRSGISEYTYSVENWLNNSGYEIDCEEKKNILKAMFASSKVAIVYGAAGTGKSTLINHVSHYFKGNKLYLTQTHAALENLRRKVIADNCVFYTINEFLYNYVNLDYYELIVIDECSTVSNKEMKELISKICIKPILLVGDTFQINSIRFGNWFSIAKRFIPKTSVFELTKPYRSNNKNLLDFWSRVRNMENSIKEIIVKQNYSSNLDASIFTKTEEDEIILCLNYDGLYGINNINRFLQENNPKTAFKWGIQQYKVGDPILFNETERFKHVIYNNMKGKIEDIVIHSQDGIKVWIQFDIELEKAISKDEAESCGVSLIKNTDEGNSVIRFYVSKTNNVDDDNDNSDSLTIVPFQIAYAVSIHKAQGLEYNSVKIVITDEIDEMITHNIFYTAITRAKEKLKIYWTPEVEEKVLSSIKPMNNQKDVGLLKLYLDKK